MYKIKQRLAIILVFAIAFMLSHELYAATAKTITTTTTVTRKDPGGVAPISCPDQGTGCTVTTTITTEIKIANVEFNSTTGRN